MYLARKKIKGKTHYIIRHSYKDHKIWCCQDLFYLGTDPYKYIIYPGGNSYYIDEQIEESLNSLGIYPDGEEIDDIFWPFIRTDIKRALNHFRARSSNNRPNHVNEAVSNSQFHLFDRRRIHYLRYSQMDQGYIGRVSPKLFHILCRKSRDEIEQYFMTSEQVLKRHEIKSYIFVIFDLQKHFSQSFAKTMPQALDQTVVDQYFLKEICKLNKDENFWAGMTINTSLHEYLIRYLTMFFDNDYGKSTYMEDIFHEWMNSRRDFRFSPKKTSVTMDEASKIFGISKQELQKMTRKELSSAYRRKAQEFHPDKGGSEKQFIKLTEAYQDIRAAKKKES